VPEIINQTFLCDSVPPEIMDRLWATGWRHFGSTFFRYSLSIDENHVRSITPLRVDLPRFELSKSQRRVLRKNEDLRHEFAPATLSMQARLMFQRHKNRFKDNVPDDLDMFLSPHPATVPCECVECRVYEGRELIALSYLDIGAESCSAVYGLFEPDHDWRSLGIYTMLRELEYSRERGLRYYYPGYATLEPSPYDYKKQLHGLETLDWDSGDWRRLPRSIPKPQL